MVQFRHKNHKIEVAQNMPLNALLCLLYNFWESEPPVAWGDVLEFISGLVDQLLGPCPCHGANLHSIPRVQYLESC